jgi:hypothetical protein
MQKETSMSVKQIRDEGQRLRYPTGKILGVVDKPADVDGLARALESAGLGNIEEISGTEGVHLLERINRSFFFSDAEERVLARHIEELKAGHLIIAIEVPSDRVDEAVSVASQNGARQLMHFGWATVTWLTK